MRLVGKSALITGAARGIGLAFAKAYLAEGAEVAIADINLAAATQAAAGLGPRAHAIALDVTRQDSIDAGFAEAIARMGKLDILINNAALFSAAPIVDISRADHEGLVAVYCATKAAVISLTQSAGLDLIRHGINVNAIAPGVVDGEHWDGVDAFFARYEGKAPGQKKREVGAAVPFGRMGTAEDLNGMAIFLATPEAKYIVAQCFGVDGGNWMA
ncbi:MAG: sorbitol dehydrogenase [Rhodobacterales bacterium 32-66-7]|nr:MAG: sorbitol dehydrogenase [Rhodobacterales bacterium 32-66-7]